MKIIYFGNFLNPVKTREESLLAKIFFKENVLKEIPFEWEETCIINEIHKSYYDGLVFDLSNLKGNHAFERQYITRMILRKMDDNPKIFFLCLNPFTYECLKHESIKDLPKVQNLFVRDTVKNTDIPLLQKFLKGRK